jgi:hypothetical protein
MPPVCLSGDKLLMASESSGLVQELVFSDFYIADKVFFCFSGTADMGK